MSSTNKTTNYNLSQYVGSDKPTYLGDYNSDMQKIDTQMKTNADGISANTSAISTANATANTALTTAQGAETSANTANTTANTANTTATQALTKANANESAINTLQTKTNGTVLYNNSNGTDGNVTCSANLSNFDKIVIIYRDNNNIYGEKIVHPDTTLTFGLETFTWQSENYFVRGKTVTINGANITVDNYGTVNASNQGILYTVANRIWITKVIGY